MTKKANPTGPKPTKHSFGFLDETGLLMTRDRLFGIGVLVPGNNRMLHKEIVKYRNRNGYLEEYKFTSIRDKNVNLYKGLIDIFFENPHSRFVAIFYDKTKYKVRNKRYRKAYNSIAGRVIAESVKLSGGSHSEYITVLADDVSTADDDKFEKEVKKKVKTIIRRNALHGVCRLESHALTEIQMCDVILGAVAYAHKIDMGIIKTPSAAKLKIVKHIQKQIGIEYLYENVSTKIRKGVKVKIHKD